MPTGVRMSTGDWGDIANFLCTLKLLANAKSSDLFYTCHWVSNLKEKHTNLESECCSPGCCRRRTELLQSFSLKKNDWDQKGYLSFICICLQLGNNMKWKKDKDWNYIQ